MAVVQISKIQVRRGKKWSGPGVPQLSSGELGWAVDSQQLYIGSGSVAEGAPDVTNVEVLTNKTNLLALFGSYRYASEDTGFTESISRSIQSKLDEVVSVKDFGAVGDGIHNDTAAFQLALDELFLSTDTKYHKQLMVPVGTYRINDDLTVPTNTVLVGESSRSVLVIGTSTTSKTVTFKNSFNEGIGGTNWNSGDLPVNILISNLTFDTTYGTVDITGLNYSAFDKVTFRGGYNALGDPITSAAVIFDNASAFGTRTNYVNFTDCKFNQVDVGVKMTQTDDFETVVKFLNCEFSVLGRGVWIDGVLNQKNLWSFNDCQFNEIATEAIWFDNGVGAKVNQCSFIRCGNGDQGDAIPYTAIVRFGQNGDNIVSDCSFSRTQSVIDALVADTWCVPEVQGGKAILANRLTKAITVTNLANGYLTVFSADVTKIEIDYTLTLTAGTRSGKLTIDVSKTEQATVISDDYTYTGTNTALMEGFTFNTAFGDYNTPADSILDTLMLGYNSGAAGTINFVARYSV